MRHYRIYNKHGDSYWELEGDRNIDPAVLKKVFKIAVHFIVPHEQPCIYFPFLEISVPICNAPSVDTPYRVFCFNRIFLITHKMAKKIKQGTLNFGDKVLLTSQAGEGFVENIEFKRRYMPAHE